MILGVLPWEKWLPPYVFGPLLCMIAGAVLVFSRPLSWWELLLMPVAGIWGAWGTWVWFKTGRNVFRFELDETSKDRADVTKDKY